MTTETSEDRRVGSVSSVERAFDIMAALEAACGPARVSELSRATQMPKATIQRLLSVLEARGFVRKDQGRYQLWAATLPLTSSFLLSNNLTKSALPVLQELAATSEETATLYVRLGFHRVVVQRVEGVRPLRYVMPIGQRLPLHLGSGKVLAAAMPRDELHQMLDQVGEIRLADGNVLSREALLSDLACIREQGYSISVNERTLGTLDVTAPVNARDGIVLAAVATVGPAERLPLDRAHHLSVDVRRAAQAIAERCRYL